jgi:hypothetical protein
MYKFGVMFTCQTSDNHGTIQHTHADSSWTQEPDIKMQTQSDFTRKNPSGYKTLESERPPKISDKHSLSNNYSHWAP